MNGYINVNKSNRYLNIIDYYKMDIYLKNVLMVSLRK